MGTQKSVNDRQVGDDGFLERTYHYCIIYLQYT